MSKEDEMDSGQSGPAPKPRAWMRVSSISGEVRGIFESENVELRSERLVPLFDQSALDAAVAADRERICGALPVGHSVDPRRVADMVRNGPDAKHWQSIKALQDAHYAATGNPPNPEHSYGMPGDWPLTS